MVIYVPLWPSSEEQHMHAIPATLALVVLLSLSATGAETPQPNAQDPLPVLALATLDLTNGELTVTLRASGSESARVMLDDLTRGRGAHGFHLYPIDPPAGVSPRAATTRKTPPPPLIPGQDRPAKPQPPAVTLTGDLVVGVSYPGLGGWILGRSASLLRESAALGGSSFDRRHYGE
jgi:hypothetical protein